MDTQDDKEDSLIHGKKTRVTENEESGIEQVVIAAVFVLTLVGGAIFWLRRRSKRTKDNQTSQIVQDRIEKDVFSAEVPELDHEETAVRELDGWHGYKSELQVNDASSGRHELPTPVKIQEIGGDGAVELEAPLR
ncbi:hypothetical protein M436DRAFT_65510 [Aureobasidium namibiae CBS 147.97]|uniref:Uncharacterized protein n=1 Tax=Aureobasidium namibiae CBS 147.97 TaxID=1043004 RepID=A0A074WNR2_9PEZI|nr:uncharacterized protein M436DRAFT_65510 [Aureobasidium namibiae CBS 147.97]KEQ71377.1 hypothetical protein M436DRAFT_65510 [Aureobasidium namibiae CBS 147.97]